MNVNIIYLKDDFKMILVRLLRINQWYKNLLVFLALIFSKQINLLNIKLSIIAFLSLCFISSANYIINDIIDIEKDRKHPEKRSRPIASGIIDIKNSILLAFSFILFSLILASQISYDFMIITTTIFILTLTYSKFIKKIIFLDILFIAVNFVIRALAGAVAIMVWISPFLIICPFFFALFLASGKRYSDMLYSKEKGFHIYSKKLLLRIKDISAILLIISFLAYIYFNDILLIFTLPFFIYLIITYSRLIEKASPIARHPDKIFKEKKILLISLIFIALVLFIIYL